MKLKAPNFGRFQIRKWHCIIDETHANEAGVVADGEPVRKVAVAATIRNPYAGHYSVSLDDIVAGSDQLGKEFGLRIVEAMGDRPVESYGKACLVGLDGEYEHGNAFLTNEFANPIREAIGGGKAWFPSTGKRGPLGTTIDVPLAYKDALYVRSHYDTLTVMFADAPAADEVTVIVVAASRGRLHARLGGITADDAVGEDGLV
jgi:hypothetical protein